MGAATSPTQLSEALDLADSFLARFVAFPVDEDRHAVALWAAHTHLLDAFASTPRLVLTSPEKQSGKSRCLEVLALLVPEALHAASITPAAMFRRMAGHPRPTVLFDEYDTVWSHRPGESAEELRALINSGHRRGASTWRCVGPTHQVEEFPTFGAVALAGIGRLPDTISDRSITIKMRRRTRRKRRTVQLPARTSRIRSPRCYCGSHRTDQRRCRGHPACNHARRPASRCVDATSRYC